MLLMMGDRIAVRVVEAGPLTAGGLALPETAQEPPHKGVVIATGPGRKGEDGGRIPLQVQLGDRVLFDKYAGTELMQGVQNLRIIQEQDIIAVVEG